MIISPGLDEHFLVCILWRGNLLRNIQGGLACLRGHTVFKYLRILSQFVWSAYYVLGTALNPLHRLLPIILLDTCLERSCYQPQFGGKEMGLLSETRQPWRGRSSLQTQPDSTQLLLPSSVKQQAGYKPGFANRKTTRVTPAWHCRSQLELSSLLFQTLCRPGWGGSVGFLLDYEMPYSFLACVHSACLVPSWIWNSQTPTLWQPFHLLKLYYKNRKHICSNWHFSADECIWWAPSCSLQLQPHVRAWPGLTLHLLSPAWTLGSLVVHTLPGVGEGSPHGNKEKKKTENLMHLHAPTGVENTTLFCTS